jgi:ABC-2 type transport system ATP-binding protein
MCDNIALINNSKKVLEGHISDVKRRFWNNTYDITINSEDELNLSKLSNMVEVEKIVMNPNFHDQKDVVLRLLEGGESKDLLRNLINNFDVHHFSEKIPSINEIFINQVEHNK